MARTTDRPSVEDRLAAVHEQLIAAVEALTSSEAWASMLHVAARFPDYSPSNILLIGMQRPDATRVAGIKTWNAVGRHVLKGEHGIAILAPCVYRAREPLDGAAPTGAADGKGGPTSEKPGAVTPVPPGTSAPDDHAVRRRELHGFRVVHVFDVSQTGGDPLPDVAPALLVGAAPADLWDHLAAEVARAGYALERGPCGAANGWTDMSRQVVRVREDVEPLQATKTLAHELGHIRADHANRFPEYGIDRTCRGQAEIEAESIAYLVLAQAGVDASAYSAPYVARWSSGDPARLREAATIVINTARALGPQESQRPADAGIEPIGRQNSTAVMGR